MKITSCFLYYRKNSVTCLGLAYFEYSSEVIKIIPVNTVHYCTLDKPRKLKWEAPINVFLDDIIKILSPPIDEDDFLYIIRKNNLD